MKYLWMTLLIVLCSGCGSNILLIPVHNHVFVQSKDGQFSCEKYNFCCWPHKNKNMLCADANIDFNGFRDMTIDFKMIIDKEKQR